jgi:hypothetical protein
MSFLGSQTSSGPQGVGKPVPRRKDERPLTGRGCYSDDFSGGRPKLRWLTVQVRVVVENDAIPGLDLPRLLARAREAVRRLK